MSDDPTGMKRKIGHALAAFPDGPIHYAQIRPYPLLPRRKWWHDMDCSGSPLARRIFTFMEWYDARGGRA